MERDNIWEWGSPNHKKFLIFFESAYFISRGPKNPIDGKPGFVIVGLRITGRVFKVRGVDYENKSINLKIVFQEDLKLLHAGLAWLWKLIALQSPLEAFSSHLEVFQPTTN